MYHSLSHAIMQLNVFTRSINCQHSWLSYKNIFISGHCSFSTQDLWHSFSQYGPPGRQITYISFIIDPSPKWRPKIPEPIFIMRRLTPIAAIVQKASTQRACQSTSHKPCSRNQSILPDITDLVYLEEMISPLF